MNELEPLRSFLTQPVPRSGGDAFLAGARARVLASARFVAGFGAAMVVVFLAIGAYAGWPDRVLDTMITIGVTGGAVLGVVLGGVSLYQRQELTVGRRLLQRGLAHDGRVASTAVTPQGITIVRMTWSGEGPRTADFRLALTSKQREALPSEAIVLEDGGDLAVFLPGLGLFATR